MRQVPSILMILAVALAGPARAESPLANAAEKQDWIRVASLLTDHADPNSTQVDGTTALHWATQHDSVETARLLIATGANAKSENRYGVTPLSLACRNGDEALVHALLAAGADANTTLPGGESVLMTAARTGRPGPVQALLDAGAKIDATDHAGQTSLMWAAADGNSSVVELLLKAGADPKVKLKSGYTALFFAAREGRSDVVRALLKAGVDVNEPVQPTGRGGATSPKNGMSALTLAIENGHFEMAAMLLDAGANPNDMRSGFSPLHILTWVRKPNRGDDADGAPPPTGSGNITSLDLVRYLVKKGANVNLRLERGSPGRGKLNLAGATPFLMACKTADLQYMKLLVELGADMTIPVKEGATPLIACAGLGTLAADEVAGTEPETLPALDYLVNQGADVNAVDQNGETAMHGAAYKNLPKVVEFLAGHGAKVEVWNQKDRYGWTPLLIAQGFRPGNYKPSAETVEAIEKVMLAAGVTPPPAPSRATTGAANYEEP